MRTAARTPWLCLNSQHLLPTVLILCPSVSLQVPELCNRHGRNLQFLMPHTTGEVHWRASSTLEGINTWRLQPLPGMTPHKFSSALANLCLRNEHPTSCTLEFTSTIQPGVYPLHLGHTRDHLHLLCWRGETPVQQPVEHDLGRCIGLPGGEELSCLRRALWAKTQTLDYLLFGQIF